MKPSFITRVLTTSGFVLGAFALAAVAGTWTAPTATPPAGNVDAPINVGLTEQTKTGPLVLNSLTPSELGLRLSGKIQIVDGNQGANRVLTSDENGIGRWAALPSGGGEGAPLVVTEYTMDHTVSTADKDIGIHDYCALSHIHTGNENFRQRVYRNTTTNHWIMHNEFAADMGAICFDGNISGGGGSSPVAGDWSGLAKVVYTYGSVSNAVLDDTGIPGTMTSCSVVSGPITCSTNKAVCSTGWERVTLGHPYGACSGSACQASFACVKK